MSLTINSQTSIKKQNLFNFYLLTSLISLALLNMSCMTDELSTHPDYEQHSIKGSGVLVSEERDGGYFHSVSMNTAGLVTVTQGSEHRIQITVDDNMMEYIVISIKDGELVIGTTPGVSLSDFNLTVDLTMTDLEVLCTNSAGSIIGKNTFEEDIVGLIINSAGNICLDLKAEQLNSLLNSAGNLMLSGEVIDHYAQVSSAGNLNAFDLQTNKTILMVNSAGNANVNVSQLLNVTINSVGSVFYKGYPEIIQHINSIGQLINVN
jgi:hypothetical protein